MRKQLSETTINILGIPYQVKCAESDLVALQQAAYLLEEKMHAIRGKQNAPIDRVAVLAALNMSHQLLKQEQRIRDLQNKIDAVLSQRMQMELGTAE